MPTSPSTASLPAEKKASGTLSSLMAKMKGALRPRGIMSYSNVDDRRLGTLLSPPAIPATLPRKTPNAGSSLHPPADKPIIGSPGSTSTQVVSRAAIEEQRLRRIAERWGIEIEPSDWMLSSKVVERVNKPIRMRLHRACHRCNTTFGQNKLCQKCQHVRCTQCPRSGASQGGTAKVGKDKSKSTAVSPPTGSKPEAIVIAASAGKLLVDDFADNNNGEGLKRKHYMLTKPSRTGGQELVRKKPMQRVRRTCHSCATLFMPGNKTCSGCGHIRCTECPRDPAKRHKYPDGYPGDVTSDPPNAFPDPGSIIGQLGPQPDIMLPPPPHRLCRKPSRFLRYTCHLCNTELATQNASGSFTKLHQIDGSSKQEVTGQADNTGTEGGLTNIGLQCGNCGHEKCEECPRFVVLPKRLNKSELEDQSLERERGTVMKIRERLESLEVKSTQNSELRSSEYDSIRQTLRDILGLPLYEIR